MCESVKCSCQDEYYSKYMTGVKQTEKVYNFFWGEKCGAK